MKGAGPRNLSKDEINDSKNIIWKYNFAFVWPFRDYSKSLRLKNVYQLSWNQIGMSGLEMENCREVLRRLNAKQVILCRGLDEKGCEICKNEKCTCKACKTTDFCRRICKFVKFLSSILLNYQLSWLDRVEPAWWVKFEAFTWVAGVRGGGWHLYQGKLFSTKTGLDTNLKSVPGKQNCHLWGDFRLSLNLYCWTTLHNLCIKTEYFLSWAEITRNFKVFPLKNSR